MSETRRGAYAPSLDEDDEFDAGAGARRGAILLIVAMVVLAAFAGVVWSAYNQGVREGGRDAPPRIAADERPFKTVPAEPGGFQTPDQDKEVYDNLSGEDRQTTENPAPPPEEPIQRETLEPAEIRSADAQSEETQMATTVTWPDPDPADAAPEEAAPQQPAGQSPAGAASRPGEDGPSPNMGDDALYSETPSDPVPDAVMPAADGQGAYLVQLAALRSTEEARATYIRVQNGADGLLDDITPVIERADLGERGIYFRLRVPGFADKASADAFCNELKARGQDCITVSR